MTASTPIRPSVQSRWPRFLAYTAAATFTLCSAATNLTYGLAKGTDLPTSIIWGAVSVAASIVLALSMPALLSSLARRHWSAAALSLTALALTGTYSVTAALGSAAGTRMTAAIVEADSQDKRAFLQSQIATAQRELATLPSARPPAELKAAIAATMAEHRLTNCDDWQRDVKRRGVCVEVGRMKVDLARAERRAELQSTIERAQSKVHNITPARIANTDAAALAGYLNALGIDARQDTLNRWLVILAVLMVECGGGLALAVGLALDGAPGKSIELSGKQISARAMEPSGTSIDRGQPETAQKAPPLVNEIASQASLVTASATNRAAGQPEPLANSAKSQVAPAPSTGQRLVKRTAERDALRDRIMTTVLTSGGRLVASERALAEMVKGTRGTTRNAVLELLAAGKLTRDDAGALVALN